MLMFAFMLVNQMIFAQKKREFVFEKTKVSYLAQSNRMKGFFDFPGVSVFILVGRENQSSEDLYKETPLYDVPIKGMDDYANFYYFEHSKIKDFNLISFFDSFLQNVYKRDMINRNHVYLIWQNEDNTFTCEKVKEYLPIITTVYSNSVNGINSCEGLQPLKGVSNQVLVTESRKRKMTTEYTVPDLLSIKANEAIKDKEDLNDYLKHLKNSSFFQFTLGNNTILPSSQSSPDRETLVDFSQIHLLWNLQMGYHLTNRLYALADFGLLFSGKQKEVKNITFDDYHGLSASGSGYAGLMARYGLGLGYMVYQKNRFSTNTNVVFGRLNAVAGGGKGSFSSEEGTSKKIKVKKENANYVNFIQNFNYHLSKSWYLNGNFQFQVADLKNELGGVKGFHGYSINLGFGYNFPMKSKEE
ncbi:hypothetical protein IQ31_05506 [Sphingobacterium siyangense]|uniref:Uncharacterized protein n=2 Tax=Sphingobacterium siyangense TaxID=459529 RepID=A0A562LZW1_9SPHI|nr:hypothetical protein IQ31_05506 [Sphingobacterium siyangense]